MRNPLHRSRPTPTIGEATAEDRRMALLAALHDRGGFWRIPLADAVDRMPSTLSGDIDALFGQGLITCEYSASDDGVYYAAVQVVPALDLPRSPLDPGIVLGDGTPTRRDVTSSPPVGCPSCAGLRGVIAALQRERDDLRGRATRAEMTVGQQRDRIAGLERTVVALGQRATAQQH
jgi:hypothetical protein